MLSIGPTASRYCIAVEDKLSSNIGGVCRTLELSKLGAIERTGRFCIEELRRKYAVRM